MANMSYCRFENTAQDLSDCEDHLEDDLGENEYKARRKLIDIAKRIVDQCFDDDDKSLGDWDTDYKKEEEDENEE